MIYDRSILGFVLVILAFAGLLIIGFSDSKTSVNSVVNSNIEYGFKDFACVDMDSDIQKLLETAEKWLKENKITDYEWQTSAGFRYHLTVRYRPKK